MKYENTFFAQQAFTLKCGCNDTNRKHWLHITIDVDEYCVPMHEQQADGSIAVLGNRTHTFGRISWGTMCRSGLQRSLADHAEQLKQAGAEILSQSKNKLVAKYRNERCMFEIKPTAVYKPCDHVR